MSRIFFELREIQIEEIWNLKLTKENMDKALFAVCSAHDPEQDLQAEIIKYLVENGANVNATDKNGVTPLHRAVRFRSPSAVKMILELGANVNVQDKKSWSTPLHRAVTNSGAPATKGKNDEAKEIINILISSGADKNLKNRIGKIPLDYIKDEETKKFF